MNLIIDKPGIVLFTATIILSFGFLQLTTLEPFYSLFASLLTATLVFGSYLVIKWIWIAAKK